jgi:hypothetical protein
MENLIEKYKDRLPRLPKSYLDFITKNKRFYGDIGHDLGYVDVWDISILNNVFDSICGSFDSMGKDWFPIGSNGGGETMCIRLSSPSKELFYIPAISTSDEHAEFFCKDFSVLYNAIKQYSSEQNT